MMSPCVAPVDHHVSQHDELVRQDHRVETVLRQDGLDPANALRADRFFREQEIPNDWFRKEYRLSRRLRTTSR